MTPAFLAIGVVLPVLLGGFTYILWRDTGMLMFVWAQDLGLMPTVMSLREWAAPARDSLPEWFLFSFPDGVWVFSCTAFFARLWPDGPAWMRWGWISLGTVLAVGGEIGQLTPLVPGTFDVMDLVYYLSSAVGAYALAQWWPRSQRAEGAEPVPA